MALFGLFTHFILPFKIRIAKQLKRNAAMQHPPLTFQMPRHPKTNDAIKHIATFACVVMVINVQPFC
jgi:hypothetical protein